MYLSEVHQSLCLLPEPPRGSGRRHLTFGTIPDRGVSSDPLRFPRLRGLSEPGILDLLSFSVVEGDSLRDLPPLQFGEVRFYSPYLRPTHPHLHFYPSEMINI